LIIAVQKSSVSYGPQPSAKRFRQDQSRKPLIWPQASLRQRRGSVSVVFEKGLP